MSERSEKAQRYFMGPTLDTLKGLFTEEAQRSFEQNLAVTRQATGQDVTRATETVIAALSVTITAIAKSGLPAGAASALVGILGSSLGAYTALFEEYADKAFKYDGLNK